MSKSGNFCRNIGTRRMDFCRANLYGSPIASGEVTGTVLASPNTGIAHESRHTSPAKSLYRNMHNGRGFGLVPRLRPRE